MASERIRNLIQSHQERELVKTAPDIVVYIDGLPYLLNPYLRKEGETSGGLIVNFNEYITAANFSYGVDSFIPSGSLSLIVPSHHRHLFQAPGGNRILNSMDEIQVYAKGYYLTKDGNSKYYRIFHGVISRVSYVDSGTSLQINISVQGLLRLFEIMRINTAPAAVRHGDIQMTGLIDNMGGLDPLLRVAESFNRAVAVEELTKSSVASINLSPDHAELIQKGYIAKWLKILDAARDAVRIFGIKKKTAKENAEKAIPDKEAADGSPMDALNKQKFTENESEQQTNYELERIKRFLPAMGPGQVNLTGSQIVSRLEIIRTMINAIMYEGYQDIDGKIIIKPPLYNLDCTKIEDTKKYPHETNPFVIYPSEIEDESEEEDEAQIRLTRACVVGVASPSIQVDLPSNLKAEAAYMNPALVRRFGLREDQPKVIPFLTNNADSIYGFAAAELYKANRNWRTFSCTIPLRPELKLGFPLFFPHHDMYAYPSTINISYNVGGRATMSISCNTIRKRPMITDQMDITTDESGSGDKGKQRMKVYASVPNLVMRWTTPAPKKDTPLEKEEGSPLGDRSEKGIPSEYQAKINYFKNRLGNRFNTEVPTTGKSWRVEKGNEYNPAKTDLTTVGGKFIIVDSKYMEKTRTVQPFTNGKGYEVVPPFPWGEGIALDTAIQDFTEKSYLPNANASELTRVVKGSDSFIYAGLAVVDPGTADNILSTLAAVAAEVSSATTLSFELTYPSPEEEAARLQASCSDSDRSLRTVAESSKVLEGMDKNTPNDGNAADKALVSIFGEKHGHTFQSRNSRDYAGALGALENSVTFESLWSGYQSSTGIHQAYLNSSFHQTIANNPNWSSNVNNFLQGNG